MDALKNLSFIMVKMEKMELLVQLVHKVLPAKMVLMVRMVLV
jgi:hypothetical protein